MSLHKTTLQRIKSQDWYRTVMMGMMPISIGLLLFLLIVNPGDILLTDWFWNLIIIPAFIGNLISPSTYIGRSGDDWDKIKKGSRRLEKFGTIVGLLAGLAFGIAIAVLHVTVPFSTTLLGIANVIFTLNQIGRFSGLGTRIGTLETTNPRPAFEKWIIGLSIVLGIGASISLYLLSATALVTISGVITFLTGGAALPVILGGVIFVCSFTSVLASAADFASRSVMFIRAQFSQDQSFLKVVNERYHEYRGSSIGSGLGLAVAATVIIALAVSQPHLFLGAAGFITAAVVCMVCVSVIGGLCARVGRLTDGLLAEPPAASSKSSTAPTVTNVQTAMANLPTPMPAPASAPDKQPLLARTTALPPTNTATFGDTYPVFGFVATNTTEPLITIPAARMGLVVS